MDSNSTNHIASNKSNDTDNNSTEEEQGQTNNMPNESDVDEKEMDKIINEADDYAADDNFEEDINMNIEARRLRTDCIIYEAININMKKLCLGKGSIVSL